MKAILDISRLVRDHEPAFQDILTETLGELNELDACRPTLRFSKRWESWRGGFRRSAAVAVNRLPVPKFWRDIQSSFNNGVPGGASVELQHWGTETKPQYGVEISYAVPVNLSFLTVPGEEVFVPQNSQIGLPYAISGRPAFRVPAEFMVCPGDRQIVITVSLGDGTSLWIVPLGEKGSLLPDFSPLAVAHKAQFALLSGTSLQANPISLVLPFVDIRNPTLMWRNQAGEVVTSSSGSGSISVGCVEQPTYGGGEYATARQLGSARLPCQQEHLMVLSGNFIVWHEETEICFFVPKIPLQPVAEFVRNFAPASRLDGAA